jgi:hypothetical protein
MVAGVSLVFRSLYFIVLVALQVSNHTKGKVTSLFDIQSPDSPNESFNRLQQKYWKMLLSRLV